MLQLLHGGGYCSGSIKSHRRMVTEAGRALGMRTLAIDYRRAPEHRFPAQHEDARTAWRFLRRQGIAAGHIAVGGDGTVNEVVNGLMRLRELGRAVPELAVVPRGTGRDFVRTFRIPARLDDALALVEGGHGRDIDVGRVAFRAWDGSDGVSYFANVGSAGMSGAVAKRANSTSKAFGGKVSFLAATLAVFAHWQPGRMDVRVDGEHREGLMYDVLVANCVYLAGGMKMTPDALPDDGLFDVLLLGDITRTDLALTLPKVYRGTHLPHPKAELLRGRSVSVDAPAPLPIELDGEQPGTTPARFELVPAAVRLRVPGD